MQRLNCMKKIICVSLVVGMYFMVTGMTHEGVVIAQDLTVVKERQDLMKEMSVSMKKLGAMAAGKKDYDRGVVHRIGLEMRDHFVRLTSLFPEDASSDDSFARMEIWQGQAFQDLMRQSEQAALSLANSNDKAGMTLALRALGGGCQQCHKSFRNPKY